MDWVKSYWVGRRLTVLQLEQGTLNHLPVVNPGVQEPWTYLEAKQKHCWGHARALHIMRLIGCILPTMRCKFLHCWELLHPFAHHCQHGPNNSQHCSMLAQQCWKLLCSFQGSFTTLSHSETQKAEVLSEKRDVQGKRLVV